MRFGFLVKPRFCPLFILAAMLISNLPEPGLVQAADAINIGSRRELFADDLLIEKLAGSARQVLQQPEPKEMVLVTGEPWEGNVSAYFTFLQDGDEFRAYYRGAHYDTVKKVMTHREVTCVALSRDGIHWTKPKLNIYDFEGSKKNNIVWDGIGTHCFVPFIDRNPAAKKSERYKAISRGRFVTGKFVTPARQKGTTGLYTFSSPDGFHWKRTSEGPVITRGAFDSQNLAFWDANRKKYVCYSRLFIDGVRSIQCCESSDFVNWTEPVKLTYVASPNEHLYTNAILPYFRNPSYYIGFPTRYMPASSRVEPLFMSSRDGTRFQRWPEAVIPESAPKDRAGNRSNYAANGLLSLPNDPTQMSIYGTEAYYEGSDSRVRRFAYRVDGFVSIQADKQGGVLETKPLIFSGKQLELNCVTRDGGSIVVTLQDGQGRALKGLSSNPIQGDFVDHVVRWKSGNGIGSLSGKVVKLRFELKNAELYSIRFAP
ncbi:MAG: hypothetical protein OSB47_07460 [Pirellulaceae bacterium]|nr:hypothetical protein [Pirellulaceae bacterium]